MKPQKIYVKPLKENGAWHVVTTTYEPVRAGYVGQGTIWYTAFGTRREAREWIKKGLWK